MRLALGIRFLGARAGKGFVGERLSGDNPFPEKLPWPNRMPRNEECIPGIWLGFDLDGEMIAGPIAFARSPVALSEAESLLKSHITALLVLSFSASKNDLKLGLMITLTT